MIKKTQIATEQRFNCCSSFQDFTHERGEILTVLKGREEAGKGRVNESIYDGERDTYITKIGLFKV